MRRLIALALPLAIFISGCAPYKYHAAPVSPPVIAASLEARSLDDQVLRSWMKQAAGFNAPSWPMPDWDLKTLTLAAYYFNPSMDVARANAAAANAAIKTAAMKPNPTIGGDGGYETAPESPYLLGFSFSLPIETAGKRKYRIAIATHLSEASRLAIAETAWQVRNGVRSALVDLIFARKTESEVRNQVALQSRYVDLLESQYRAGEIALPAVTTAQIDLTSLHQALSAAEGQVGTARASLASAIGIPLSGLTARTVVWPDADALPGPAQLPTLKVRAEAVENRLDVQQALAQYEAAQSNLQLEVARQYPNLNLGPGYAFEESIHLISLQASTVLPIRNQNQGPIAQAVAQRKAAGAVLLRTQDTVIGQTDQALARYDAAFSVLKAARRSVAQVETQRRFAYHQLQKGEADRLAAVSADLQLAVAERARIAALQQAQMALGVLENALEKPIGSATTAPLPEAAPRQKEF